MDSIASVFVKMENRLNERAAYIYGVTSYAFQCCANLQIKFIGDIPPMQAALIRNVQFAIYGYFHLKYLGLPTTPKVDPKLNRLLIYRCLLGSFGIFLHFFSLKRIPISEFVVIYQTTPILTSILAVYMLREKLEGKQIISLFIAIIGVTLIVKPPFLFQETNEKDFEQLMAAGSVIMAACIDSFILILIRQLGGKVPNPFIVFIYGIIGSGFAGMGCIYLGIRQFSLGDILHLIILGVCYYAAQIMRNRAFQLGNAGKVSITLSSEVVFSSMADYLLFGFIPDGLSIIGSLMIVSCVMMMILSKFR